MSGLFPADDIPRIIQNILNCCEKLTRSERGEKENKLSERLYKALLKYTEYHTGPIQPHIEAATVICEDEEPDITGRVDINFYCGRGIQTYFAVEAKRLYVTYPSGKLAALVSDYIDDGMMRYVKGQYSSKMISAAMLGYVFDKPLIDARSVLSAVVSQKKKTLKLSEEGAWCESQLAVNPSIDETQHELSQGPFTMFHILTQVMILSVYQSH